MLHKMVRPDSKGRITLGPLAQGVSGYLLTETEDHKIILVPYAEIPAREKWLFMNKTALNKIEQGLHDARASHLVDKGSFAKFLKEDEIE